MADYNENQDGVFGGVKFNQGGTETENTSYFEGTVGTGSTGGVSSGVSNGIYGNDFTNGTSSGVYGSGSSNGTTNGVFGGTSTNGESSSVYGSFKTSTTTDGTVNDSTNFQPIQKDKAITKQGLWSKIKAFLFQEIDLNAPIKVELTPYQQKVEDEINEFLHQDISFKGITNIFKGKK